MTDPESQKNSCSMVGLLSILIQVALGALSFSVLVIKRYYQKPKRPWKIWSFDASKQIISQMIAHFINLTISLALSSDKNSDQCLWYFVTNIFDNTMGVTICIILLKLIQNNLRKRRKFELISGNYYKRIEERYVSQSSNLNENQIKSQQLKIRAPNNQSLNHKQIQIKYILNQDSKKQKQQSLISQDSRSKVLNLNIDSAFKKQQIDNKDAQNIQIQNDQQQSLKVEPDEIMQENNYVYIIDYKAWIIQLGIWNGVVIIGKCALFGLEFGLEKQLQDLSMFILGWIQEYPILELFVVIIIVPVIMNGLAYWVQDNFLMKKQKILQQKNLLEQNQKDNQKKGDDIQDPNDIRSQKSHPQKSGRNRKESDFSIGKTDHIQFDDDYDAKDQDNPSDKFENFDKFGKFAL